MKDDDKFFSILSIIFGLLGCVSSLIICTFIILYKIQDILIGDYSFIYYFILVIVCFLLNNILRRKISNENLYSRIGKILGFISLIPFIVFILFLLIVLVLTPILVNFEPKRFP